MSKDLKQTVLTVNHAAVVQGLSVLYGVSGAGISYALRSAVQRLDQSCQTYCHMSAFHVSARDAYKEMCREMGVIPSAKGRQGMITAIREKAITCKKQGHPIFLTVDHAENLPELILLDLPALISGPLGVGHMMTILLCGTTQLKWNMESLQSENFRIDFGAHYAFSGLDEKETKEYLLLQLSKAGAGPDFMTEDALNLAHAVSSHGNFKELNSIMREAMQLCFQTKRTCIDKTVLSAAVSRQKL